tara:strand:+ start:21402 stop:21995 length:594 start_codon:yes stop_codon:yes gene_type:complete
MTDQSDFHIGERAEAAPVPTQFEPSPFRKSRPPEPLYFEVNVVAEAHDRQKKSGVVQVNIPGFSPVKLYCDEQTPVGDDTAPPPLAFFSAGIAFCLMTHLTDILTARKIQVDSLRLEQRIRFMTNLGTMRELGHTTDGRCEKVETHVIIESPESEESIQALLAEAEGACMAHFALRNPIPWSTRLVHNNRELISNEG